VREKVQREFESKKACGELEVRNFGGNTATNNARRRKGAFYKLCISRILHESEQKIMTQYCHVINANA
jgi:hypothetical protein